MKCKLSCTRGEKLLTRTFAIPTIINACKRSRGRMEFQVSKFSKKSHAGSDLHKIVPWVIINGWHERFN